MILRTTTMKTSWLKSRRWSAQSLLMFRRRGEGAKKELLELLCLFQATMMIARNRLFSNGLAGILDAEAIGLKTTFLIHLQLLNNLRCHSQWVQDLLVNQLQLLLINHRLSPLKYQHSLKGWSWIFKAEVKIKVFFSTSDVFPISVRLQSQDTPLGGQILDIGEQRLRGAVRRLPGRGLTPVDVSTPAEDAPPPAHPDVSSVLEPVQLEFR